MEEENIQQKDINQTQGPVLSGAEGFGGLGIAEKIMQSLARLQFTEPTPIQHQVIPVALEGKDIIGIAQTGTGKTLAFGIPMIQRLAVMPGKQALVILPTRELALQVEESLQRVGQGIGLRTAVLIGGTGMGMQLRQLRAKPHIIIATPGRLNDHLEQKNMNLHNVAILVLDEADHMLDMGFAPQIKKILALLPKERQNMLFSATMPPEILKIATTYMQLPLLFEIAPHGTTAECVEHELFFTPRESRLQLLHTILREKQGNALVFLRTKHAAKKICKQLLTVGISSAELHSNRSLNQRKAALEGFKRGQYRVLVATDIASRGIDIKGLALVVNYDLPESAGDYVHRIGRTGRASMPGKAISFAMPDQKHKVREIERLIRYALPVSKDHKFLPVNPQPVQEKYVPANYHSRRPSRHPHKKFTKKW